MNVPGSKVVLAIDEGTTNARAALYNQRGERIAMHAVPTRSYFPQPGWVEQDAMEIWRAQMSAVKAVVERSEMNIAACGITNQRETVVVWDPRTGEPIAPAIVWQCRRTADMCAELARSRRRRLDRTKDRSRDRRVFFRQQNPLDSRQRSERARAGRKRRDSVRQHRHLADLEADGRQGPRDRRQQRFAHHADGSRNRRSGTTSCCAIFEVPRAMLPRIVPSSGRVGQMTGDLLTKVFRSAESQAISRRRWRGRRAFAPDCRKTLMEPAASR